jgi:hypothetical protein
VLEDVSRLAARIHQTVANIRAEEADPDAVVGIMERDRRAVALAVLDELEREASGITVAMTVSQPQPLAIAMGRLRERYR